jgi:hypothetical protein
MRNRLPVLIVAFLLAAFGAGVYYLFSLRLQLGDVYAPYSSLRADPLGAMAIYEAFERMPGLTVRRDFTAANKLPEGTNIAYLHIGADARLWQNPLEEITREAERFAVTGGRLVILLYPEISPPTRREIKAAEREPRKESAEKKKVRKKESDNALKVRWKLGFDYVELEETDDGSVLPEWVTSAGVRSLPETLEWHSSLVFTNLPAEWTPIYYRGDQVVMAELRRGPGSIVIGTDSYHVSNEALSTAPEPGLLAWLAGSSREIVFDEAHLGTSEKAGVARLMRKYRLGWFMAAVLLLGLLFVWKESAPFVPRNALQREQRFVEGKSASAGFINLLRRNVPARELPRVCLEQWKQAFLPRWGGNSSASRTALTANPVGARSAQDKAAAAESILRHGTERDPVAIYNQLCPILKTRSTKHTNDKRTT